MVASPLFFTSAGSMKEEHMLCRYEVVDQELLGLIKEFLEEEKSCFVLDTGVVPLVQILELKDSSGINLMLSMEHKTAFFRFPASGYAIVEGTEVLLEFDNSNPHFFVSHQDSSRFSFSSIESDSIKANYMLQGEEMYYLENTDYKPNFARWFFVWEKGSFVEYARYPCERGRKLRQIDSLQSEGWVWPYLPPLPKRFQSKGND